MTGIDGDAQTSLEYAQTAHDMAVRTRERSGEAWSLMYRGYALLMLGDLEQARASFLRSVAIRNELDQPSLVMEPLAGMIHVALQENDLVSALENTENILFYFKRGGTLEGAEEPLRIYHACFLTLKQHKDPRSGDLLRDAAEFLTAQLAKIHDIEARRRYVENVPWRRDIEQAWSAVN